MATRLTLLYNFKNVHALMIATPWIRLLVETESPGGNGHTIGNEVSLRKTTNALGIITAIEIEQLSDSPDAAQRYLSVCEWWLGRKPFGLSRLPVSLIAHAFTDTLVRVGTCRVTKLDLSATTRASALVDFSVLSDVLANLEELDVSTSYPYMRHIANAALLHNSQFLRHVKLAGTDVETLDFLSVNALETIDVSKCTKLRHVRQLSLAQKLRTFAATAVDAESLEPLRACASLEEVEVNRWHSLADLSPLESSARTLRYVCASCTAIQNLSCLANCHALKRLELACCSELKDFKPLAGLASLEALIAYSTGVEALGDLHKCPQLTTLDISFSDHLSTLTGLAGAPSLTTLNVYSSAVQCIDGIGSCPNLNVVRLGECGALRDLSPLSGAMSLTEVDAHNSGVTDVTGLNLCPALRVVTLSSCRGLTSLAGFAGAPSLLLLDAQQSGVAILTGLNTCPTLHTLILKRCGQLDDLSPLAGAPALRKIDATGAHVINVDGLEDCKQLTKLGMHGCPGASTAQHVQKLLRRRKKQQQE